MQFVTKSDGMLLICQCVWKADNITDIMNLLGCSYNFCLFHI